MFTVPKIVKTARKEELDCELANILAEDGHPVNLLRGTGFQKFIGLQCAV
jgi:hypothetical protein